MRSTRAGSTLRAETRPGGSALSSTSCARRERQTRSPIGSATGSTRRRPRAVSTLHSWAPARDHARVDHVLEPERLGERQHRAAPEHLARRAARDDAPALDHDRDLARDLRLVRVVRDPQDRDLELVAHAQQMAQHAGPQRQIERGERLVEQQRARAARRARARSRRAGARRPRARARGVRAGRRSRAPRSRARARPRPGDRVAAGARSAGSRRRSGAGRAARPAAPSRGGAARGAGAGRARRSSSQLPPMRIRRARRGHQPEHRLEQRRLSRAARAEDHGHARVPGERRRRARTRPRESLTRICVAASLIGRLRGRRAASSRRPASRRARSRRRRRRARARRRPRRAARGRRSRARASRCARLATPIDMNSAWSRRLFSRAMRTASSSLRPSRQKRVQFLVGQRRCIRVVDRTGPCRLGNQLPGPLVIGLRLNLGSRPAPWRRRQGRVGREHFLRPGNEILLSVVCSSHLPQNGYTYVINSRVKKQLKSARPEARAPCGPHPASRPRPAQPRSGARTARRARGRRPC